ncbi:MOSC domain-containing protein [Parasedimentitalea huanghaiensis]|uniref:Sulfurase n=1 Tax=Parasedimentitalea huanghaiensis TaxID=2682100 RepID=A0A6L6WLD7_9RHOB|nr:sulfurase [Zongyanglinia huanghaiensis]MVO16777.1 sulfurase [Zongyanglinia huanghaiensis]
MPTLIETEFQGVITWLGHVAANDGLRAKPVSTMDLGFEGDAGARHAGVNRESCVRVKNLYPQGTEIRNVRQLSILSEEELALIAADMGMEKVDPAHLGVSIVVRGIPDFTFVPPASRLQGPDGVTVVTDTENRPCIFPAKEIEKDHAGFGPKFKPAAKNRRGITAWVERPGKLTVGQPLRLFIPDQRAWAP